MLMCICIYVDGYTQLGEWREEIRTLIFLFFYFETNERPIYKHEVTWLSYYRSLC